jgi:hypothetical protein
MWIDFEKTFKSLVSTNFTTRAVMARIVPWRFADTKGFIKKPYYPFA